MKIYAMGRVFEVEDDLEELVKEDLSKDKYLQDKDYLKYIKRERTI